MAAYQAALAGKTVSPIEIGASQSKPGSVAAAVALYLGSMDFGNLALTTQRDRRLILDRFREEHGEKTFARSERRHVEMMIAAKARTPHAARNLLKALRAVSAGAIRAGLRDDDPTTGIRVKRGGRLGQGSDSPSHSYYIRDSVGAISSALAGNMFAVGS